MAIFTQMHESERWHVIEKHNFLTEQCKKRLISQFSDIEGECDEYVKAYAKELEPKFDHENGDWGSFWGQVNSEACSHYFLLRDMKKITILSLTAAVYHNWDKSFRGWLTNEMRFSFEEEHTFQIWGASISEIMELFCKNGWDVASTPDMKKILVMQDVVNAYKHGAGRSFRKIRDVHTDYLDEYITDSSVPGGYNFTAKHDNLNVKESQFDDFAEAIKGFWLSVPSEISWAEEK